MPSNRIGARWRRNHKVAKRYAAIAMVGAYEMLGRTRSVAVASTAADLNASARSIWRWLDWAGSELPSTYTLECLGALPEDLR